MSVAVFFFKAPRTPLIAAARADIEAAVKIRRRRRPGKAKDTSARPSEMRRRYLVGLVCEFGPPALGADIPGARRPRWEQLRARLNAPERYGKRDRGAQQAAICHPVPPVINTRVTMVVPPPLTNLRHPGYRWQTIFAAVASLVRKSTQNATK